MSYTPSQWSINFLRTIQMENNQIGSVRAFVRGFALLSRSSASQKATHYRVPLLAGLLVALYYVVQGFYFLYHGKQHPRETVSDGMSMTLQLFMVPVLYLGFHALVVFVLRPEVQAAFDRRVEQARVVAQFILRHARAFFRRALRRLNSFIVMMFHVVAYLSVATAWHTRTGIAQSRVRIAGMAGKVNRFADRCVEAGRNTQS
jgi:hypothetical protein